MKSLDAIPEWRVNWGEDGFFRIEAGVNALNIESHCGFATVLDPDPPRGDLSHLPCENGVPRV